MAAAREYTITYNSQLIPATINGVTADLHSVHRVRKSSSDFEVNFEVILHSAPTAASLALACASIEASFRAPISDLSVSLSTLGGGDTGTTLSLLSSNNDAFNVEASIEKVGSEVDSARSRLYEVSITGELPWTLGSPGAGRQGLRSFEYNLEFSASRRGQVTFSGEYTMQSGGNAAQAQHDANISDLITPILSGLTGNWPTFAQPTGQTSDFDIGDGAFGFTRTYKELVASEKIGAIDDADVLDQRLTVIRETTDNESDPGSPITEAPQRLSASYEASIDQTRTKDLKGLWESTLRDWVIQNIRNATNSGGPIRLISERLVLNPVDNIVGAELEFEVFTGLRFVSLTVDITTEMNAGHIISRTWPQKATRRMPDLVPTSAYVFDGPREIKQTVVTTRTTRGPSFPIDLFTGGSIGSSVGTIQQGGKSILIVLSRSSANRRRRVGNSTIGQTVDLLDEIRTEVIELIEKVN
jgi:hypothetical protein